QGAPLHGRLTLALKLKAGQLAFRLAGTKLDLATLKTKTPDLTIALEFGEGTAVASTRRYRVNKSGAKIDGPGGGGEGDAGARRRSWRSWRSPAWSPLCVRPIPARRPPEL